MCNVENWFERNEKYSKETPTVKHEKLKMYMLKLGSHCDDDRYRPSSSPKCKTLFYLEINL